MLDKHLFHRLSQCGLLGVQQLLLWHLYKYIARYVLHCERTCHVLINWICLIRHNHALSCSFRAWHVQLMIWA